jgi:DNA-binding NarL/FixJ family response regulator
MSANILVVEDEFLVAMQIETVLREVGWGVTGPASTLANAVKLARSAG